MSDLNSAFKLGMSIAGAIGNVVVAGREDFGESPSETDGDLTLLNYKGLQNEFPDRTAEIENIIKRRDPGFSSEEFLGYAKELFNAVEAAMANNDLKPLAGCFREELHTAMSKKLRMDFINGKRHYKNVEADTVYLTSYADNAESECAAVYITVKRIPWNELSARDKTIGKEADKRLDERYRIKLSRGLTGGGWVLCQRELIKYNTVDEGVCVSPTS